MCYWDNDFDRKFDEAVDEIDRKARAKKSVRLIDANKLKAHYAWWAEAGDPDMKDAFDTIIDLQPTVEAEPKHGRWLEVKTTVEVQETLGCRFNDRVFKCSVCGNLETTRSNYCRRCGAKMDEVPNG